MTDCSRPSPLRRIDSEPPQIDQHVRFQKLRRRHRQGASRAIAAAKQRSDSVRHGPDVERDHQGRRAACRGHCGADFVGGAAQHGEGPFAGFPQPRISADRNAGFEHRRVERRLTASEFEIGLAEPVQRREFIGTSVVPGARQRRRELLEAGVPAGADSALREAGERAFAVLRGAADAICAAMPATGRPPALMVALHIWAMAHGVASLFGRGDGAQRALPMSPAELLEANMLVYLRGLGINPARP